MRPSPFELKELQRQELRLRAFKERNFDEQQYDDWVIPIVITAFSITMVGAVLFSLAYYYFSR